MIPIEKRRHFFFFIMPGEVIVSVHLCTSVGRSVLPGIASRVRVGSARSLLYCSISALVVQPILARVDEISAAQRGWPAYDGCDHTGTDQCSARTAA